MPFTYFGRNAELRIYDGTAGTVGPNYLEMKFQNADFSGPLARPRPDQVLKLDRGKITADAHYIVSDDSAIAQPQPFSFSLGGVDTLLANAIAALGNPLNASTWTVGNKTWTEVDVTALTLINGDGANVAVPNVSDSVVRFTNLEIKWNKTSTEAAAADLVLIYQASWYPPEQIQVRDAIDGMSLNVNGMLYGNVVKATAFSTGIQTDT